MNEAVSRRRFLTSTGAATAVVVTSTALSRRLAGAPAAGGKIRVGQIGVGHAHASGKMGSYRRSSEYEVVGIVEPDPELRARAEKQDVYRGLTWMTQEELLNVPGLKTVAIETRVRDLLAAAEASVDAGMHIHLDKPPGSSLPRFRRILNAATKKRLVVQMGYMYRYNPAVVLLRDFLEKGWLGEVFEIHTVMSKTISAASRRELSEYPGGTMFELGCHIIDLAVGVLGRPDKVTAYTRHSSPHDDTLVDNMLAVFEYPRAIASVKSSVQEVSGFARRHFVVCGTEGTFHIQPLDRPSVRVALSQARGKYVKGYQDIALPKYTRYVDDATDLAQIIRGEKATDFPPEHDDAVQEAVLKASRLPLNGV